MRKDNVNDRLNVPPRLKVGFAERGDTYTGILAYVIYFDAKGKLCKEKSWEGWRDKKLEPKEMPNEPTTGFVINRQVGGVSGYRSWGDHDRIEKVRVWDPRGWEFEVTIPNLLFLLQESSCTPGKGLGAKCVYAWNGASLVLLPVNSQAYVKSVSHTKLQTLNVKQKELVAGYTYETKQQKHYVYLGKLDYRFAVGNGFVSQLYGARKTRYEKDLAKGILTGCMKRHVFAEQVAMPASVPRPVDADDDDDLEDEVDEAIALNGGWKLHYRDDVKIVARPLVSEVADNFASLMDLHNKSFRGSPVAKLILRSVKPDKNTRSYGSQVAWAFEHKPGVFADAHTEREYDRATNDYTGQAKKTHMQHAVYVRDGVLVVDSSQLMSYHPSHREDVRDGWHSTRRVQPVCEFPWTEPTNDKLFAVLESGVEVPLSSPTTLGKE